jgi:hypothetical protein
MLMLENHSTCFELEREQGGQGCHAAVALSQFSAPGFDKRSWFIYRHCWWAAHSG